MNAECDKFHFRILHKLELVFYLKFLAEFYTLRCYDYSHWRRINETEPVYSDYSIKKSSTPV